MIELDSITIECVFVIAVFTVTIRYKVHGQHQNHSMKVFIRYTVHDSTRTIDMKVSIMYKVHDSTIPIDMNM